MASSLMEGVHDLVGGICLTPMIKREGTDTNSNTGVVYNSYHYTHNNIMNSNNKESQKWIQNMFLHVRAVTNQPAVKFYKNKFNYLEYECLTAHYDDGEDALLLQKPIFGSK